MKTFIQDSPELSNQYVADKALQSILKKYLPENVFLEVEHDLTRFGERVITDVLEMANNAESNPPTLKQYDAWGNRIDEIIVSKGWKDLERVAAEEGMVAIGYERKFQEYSRIWQIAKLYLFEPSSAVYTCPLAMTDGAARLIEVHGNDFLKNEIYPHLISRNPDQFWTSGQWMTEKTGGSDVGRSETIANYELSDYKLNGLKWFTSATTSQMAFTLARIADENGNVVQGSRGLSLFFVKLCNENGRLNNIEIHRLKDKLGTKALPTAELSLCGTPALLVGEQGQGVKRISTLFNITRIYNANSSVAMMRRCLALIKDYSAKRNAFGKLLADHPLHIETIASLEVEYRGALVSLFSMVSLLGKEECGKASAEETSLLRILTPLIKLYTAKQAVRVISEVLELFGGAGYVEDTGLPRFLRNAQVLPIWEGTTNILSLDVLRSIEKENTFEPFVQNIKQRLDTIQNKDLQGERQKVSNALASIQEFMKATTNSTAMEAEARPFAYSLFRVFAASLLLEQAEWSLTHEQDRSFLITAKRWCQNDLISLPGNNEEYRQESKDLALGDYELKALIKQ